MTFKQTQKASGEGTLFSGGLSKRKKNPHDLTENFILNLENLYQEKLKNSQKKIREGISDHFENYNKFYSLSEDMFLIRENESYLAYKNNHLTLDSLYADLSKKLKRSVKSI